MAKPQIRFHVDTTALCLTNADTPTIRVIWDEVPTDNVKFTASNGFFIAIGGYSWSTEGNIGGVRIGTGTPYTSNMNLGVLVQLITATREFNNRPATPEDNCAVLLKELRAVLDRHASATSKF